MAAPCLGGIGLLCRNVRQVPRNAVRLSIVHSGLLVTVVQACMFARNAPIALALTHLDQSGQSRQRERSLKINALDATCLIHALSQMCVFMIS